MVEFVRRELSVASGIRLSSLGNRMIRVSRDNFDPISALEVGAVIGLGVGELTFLAEIGLSAWANSSPLASLEANHFRGIIHEMFINIGLPAVGASALLAGVVTGRRR
ncbi:hypothetical protein M1437_01080 [Patescibacteria group bacterium]|nr:hypothetical protein [Patescibacteria group bacterium]